MKLKQITKAILHPQIFLLLASLLFLWYTFTVWALNNIAEGDLIAHSGLLTNMDTVNTNSKQQLGYRGKTNYYLRFTIDKEPNRMFTLLTRPQYDYIISSQLKVGDSVTLFTLPRFGSKLFGFAEASSEVQKLSKGDKLVFHNTSLYARKNYLWLYINLITSLTFFILYIVKLRRKIFSENHKGILVA